MAIALLLLGVIFAGHLQTGETNLISDPAHKTDTCTWMSFDGQSVELPKLDGEKVYSVHGSPYGVNGVLEWLIIHHPPTETRLRFTMSVRASEAGQSFLVVTAGLNPKLQPDQKDLTLATSPSIKMAISNLAKISTMLQKTTELAADRWSNLSYDISLPAGTDEFRMIIHNPNKGTIFMSLPKLEVGPPMPPDSEGLTTAKSQYTGFLAYLKNPPPSPVQKFVDDLAKQPGVVIGHLQLRAPVRTLKDGEIGHVTFPVPPLCSGQVPLAFKVAQSPNPVVGFKWVERSDKRNWVCDVSVRPGTKGAFVKFEALVLLGGPNSRDMSPPSAEGGDWSSSTACVQCAAPEIKAVAKSLSAPGQTEEAYARKVFAFVRDDQGKGAPFNSLDALAGLQCGGSCTNKANLVAALLRAHGIPARTVCHMPTWYGAPLDYHWLTEYWQPGKGWVAVDSALGRWEPDRRSRMVLNVASRKDEDRAFDPLHERFVMPGAPYYSVIELSKELYPASISQVNGFDSADQVALLNLPSSAQDGLFKSATASYRQMLRGLETGKIDAGRYDRILRLAQTGEVAELSELLGTSRLTPKQPSTRK